MKKATENKSSPSLSSLTKEQVEGQKKEVKPIEVEGVEEWEVEKILNKKKIKEVNRYLVRWKGFMAKSNTWKKEENLENARELVNKFEERLGAEVRRQEGVEQRWKVKLNPKVEEFKRSELLEKYTAKLLFRWDNRKFEDEYLKKLERNWQK